jgi:hypothetical protein
MSMALVFSCFITCDATHCVMYLSLKCSDDLKAKLMYSISFLDNRISLFGWGTQLTGLDVKTVNKMFKLERLFVLWMF